MKALGHLSIDRSPTRRRTGFNDRPYCGYSAPIAALAKQIKRAYIQALGGRRTVEAEIRGQTYTVDLADAS
jgi:hypothetical protein